jgi:hypothetical protein
MGFIMDFWNDNTMFIIEKVKKWTKIISHNSVKNLDKKIV